MNGAVLLKTHDGAANFEKYPHAPKPTSLIRGMNPGHIATKPEAQQPYTLSPKPFLHKSLNGNRKCRNAPKPQTPENKSLSLLLKTPNPEP